MRLKFPFQSFQYYVYRKVSRQESLEIVLWLEIGPLTLSNDRYEHKPVLSIFTINCILHSIYSATLAQYIIKIYMRIRLYQRTIDVKQIS